MELYVKLQLNLMRSILLVFIFGRIIRSRFKTYHINGRKTNIPKPPPPWNITLAKGSVHVVLVRGAVEFMMKDQRALDFSNWTITTGVPDETFFVTMNVNPHLGMPGTYNGKY